MELVGLEGISDILMDFFFLRQLGRFSHNQRHLKQLAICANQTSENHLIQFNSILSNRSQSSLMHFNTKPIDNHTKLHKIS